MGSTVGQDKENSLSLVVNWREVVHHHRNKQTFSLCATLSRRQNGTVLQATAAPLNKPLHEAGLLDQCSASASLICKFGKEPSSSPPTLAFTVCYSQHALLRERKNYEGNENTPNTKLGKQEA
eukprot:1157936-Pelagomonas_calceolata.AAC.7